VFSVFPTEKKYRKGGKSMAKENKEAVAVTTTSFREINKEFLDLTLKQIQQLKTKVVDSVDPNTIQEVRKSVELINMNKMI
jgi:hypothetical protein